MVVAALFNNIPKSLFQTYPVHITEAIIIATLSSSCQKP
jgi:hypothetical protein